MTAIEKNTVTEEERNAVFLILTPSEFQSFENSLSNLIEEYRDNGTLKLTSIIPILGNPPTIPQSLGMDAMLEAYEERAEYGKKTKAIEDFFKYEVPKLEV